jgi:Transposase DDE domain
MGVRSDFGVIHYKTFSGIAQRGKTSVDWFYGFK